MKAAVIIFPGSNCDHDVYYVFRKILNLPTEFVWHKETDLEGFDLIILPGGFSYGDYLRCGAIARFSPVMKEVRLKALQGVSVIGICNGFQILTEAGLLPGVLLKNMNQKFICKTVHLRVDNITTRFTSACGEGEVLRIPVAHGEGNYFCDDETLAELKTHDQIVFRYTDPSGQATVEANANGSIDNIAGIINKEGNILGMMPHPERRSDRLLGHDDGLKIFMSLVHNLVER